MKKIIGIVVFIIVFSPLLAVISPRAAYAENDEGALVEKSSDVDFSELYNLIEKERKELEEKRKELEEQEKMLKALQADITKEYEKLDKIRKELEKEFSSKEEKKEVEIKNIVKLYESMNPEEAAKAIEKMDTKLAAQLISQINPRKSGKILDAMDTMKVKEITKEMYFKQMNK